MFHKKRRKPKPNKNTLKMARQEARDRLGKNNPSLRQVAPEVTRVKINWRIQTASGVVLEEGEKVLGGGDSSFFEIECPGGCGSGKFSFQQSLEAELKAHHRSHQGMGICQEQGYAHPGAVCDTRIHYDLAVEYTKT